MNLLALFPELQKEFDATLEGALGKVASSGFQRSKERVIIAETFFSKKPDLLENDRRELVAMIKAVDDSKALKSHLKDWGPSSAGGSSSFLSALKSLFLSQEQTSKSVDEAVRWSRDMKDWEFLTALPEKVSKEPLLEQLAQDVMKEAHQYFQEFMERSLPRLYFRAYNIKRQMMYHHVELAANEQDQKRRESSRSDWFNEIRMAQAQVNSG